MPAARVTLREVARLAGVNPATVSRVLNPETRHLVTAKTAQRVQAAVRRLDYEPNRLARGLRTRRSYSIGVVIPDLTNPLFPPIVRGIENALAPAGYTALLTNTDGDPERERQMFETLRGRQVDGFIIASAATRDSLILGALEEGVPLVLVNRTLDREGIFAVVPDDRRGIQHAVEHLAALGHRSIGHVAAPQRMSTGLRRYRGFLEAMSECGLEVLEDAVVFATGFTEEAGAVAALQLLSSGANCTAVVAANDLIALGVYSAAAKLGLRLPQDLSVVGFNNMPFVDKLAPPLTTVNVPVYDLGVRAAELLLERLQDETAQPRTLLLETRLIERGSTAPPPGPPG